MSDPLKIRNPVREEMDQFEAYFGRMMKSNIPFLKIILNYVFRRKGKQMRPMLVFLTAKLNGGTGEAACIRVPEAGYHSRSGG